MCTLVIGFHAVAKDSVVLAANRDEDPSRPSAPPGVLLEAPRVVGGRDLLKRGTWLAIRERRAAVAMLNRREQPGVVDPGRRSRGLLALEVAAAGDGSAEAALAHGLAAARTGAYAPFSLVYAAPEGSWLLANDGEGAVTVTRVPPGWHALTHADLDDRDEPRTAWLVRQLAGFAPRTPVEAERRLQALLRSHGSETPGAEVAPAVCLHQGRMVTVSSATVYVAPDQVRYFHAEGRPCEHEARDFSHLLAGPRPALERS